MLLISVWRLLNDVMMSVLASLNGFSGVGFAGCGIYAHCSGDVVFHSL